MQGKLPGRLLRSTTLGVLASLALILLGATPALAAKPAAEGHTPWFGEPLHRSRQRHLLSSVRGAVPLRSDLWNRRGE